MHVAAYNIMYTRSLLLLTRNNNNTKLRRWLSFSHGPLSTIVTAGTTTRCIYPASSPRRTVYVYLVVPFVAITWNQQRRRRRLRLYYPITLSSPRFAYNNLSCAHYARFIDSLANNFINLYIVFCLCSINHRVDGRLKHIFSAEPNV